MNITKSAVIFVSGEANHLSRVRASIWGFIERRLITNLDNLGRRIQFLRQKRKISQMDLAEILGISRQYMGFIENDERTPSLDIVIKLAEAFGITVDDLLGRQLNTKEEAEMYSLLTDCSPEESTILMENMKALKSILHKHKIT